MNHALYPLYLGPLATSPPTVTPAGDSLDFDAIAGEVDIWYIVELERGGFCSIDADRVDLPPDPALPVRTCIRLLPARSQQLFYSPSGGLCGELRRTDEAQGSELPPPLISALPGHFEKVISRACASAMVVWTGDADEKPEDAKFSDSFTVTSFAVCKDFQSDRLISWPRLPNALFAPPPKLDLPHDGALADLHVV